MQQFSLLAATRSIEKSMPFVLFRLLVCLGVSLGYLLATLGGAGTAVGVGSLGSNATGLAPIGAIVGFCGFGYLMFRLRATWLRSLKAVHLALLAEHAKGTALPEGKAQIDFAKNVAKERFPGASDLFELLSLISAALREIAAQQPPILGAGTAAAPWVSRAVGALFALNGRAVLAWHVYHDGSNPWHSARDALPFIAANFKTLLKYRLFASVFEWLGFIAAVAVISIPFNNIAASLPFQTGIWPSVFAVLFGWTLKAAFFEPIAESAMMQSLFPLLKSASGDNAASGLAERSTAYKTIAEHP